jgi:hypothetical protein
LASRVKVKLHSRYAAAYTPTNNKDNLDGWPNEADAPTVSGHIMEQETGRPADQNVARKNGGRQAAAAHPAYKVHDVAVAANHVHHLIFGKAALVALVVLAEDFFELQSGITARACQKTGYQLKLPAIAQPNQSYNEH